MHQLLRQRFQMYRKISLHCLDIIQWIYSLSITQRHCMCFTLILSPSFGWGLALDTKGTKSVSISQWIYVLPIFFWQKKGVFIGLGSLGKDPVMITPQIVPACPNPLRSMNMNKQIKISLRM